MVKKNKKRHNTDDKNKISYIKTDNKHMPR